MSKQKYWLYRIMVLVIITVIFISGCVQTPESTPTTTQPSETPETTPQQTQLQEPECTPDWQCSVWSRCSASGTQTRTCIDSNNCGITTDKPIESQSCTPIDIEPISVDMLIFISSQYSEDSTIFASINNYIAAVNEDIGWKSEIIKVNPKENDFKKIDEVIEQHKPKAVIMVGEDIDTALAAEFNDAGMNIERPSTIPWSTLGGENAYHIEEEADYDPGQEHNPIKGKLIVFDRPYKINVSVSLIYPVSNLDYDEKSERIVSLFNKFSIDRNKDYGDNINVFADYLCGDINDCMDIRRIESFRRLSKFGKLNIIEDDASEEDVFNTYGTQYKAYFVDGHGTPSSSFNFRYNHLLEVKTPFFSVGGCNVCGWYSEYQEPNGLLDPPKKEEWFGNAIFHNHQLRVVYFNPGEPKEIFELSPMSQQELIDYYKTDKVPLDNFMYNGTDDFFSGKTIAESMIGRIYSTEQFIYGDPTFHYSIERT